MKAFLKGCAIWIQIIATSFEFAYGRWRLEHLPRPRVTIFGGHRLSLGHPYAIKAHELASNLVNAGVAIVTGGGAGIMEAANCGASHAQHSIKRQMTIGIGIRGLPNEGLNMCAKSSLMMHYFFSRKWLLANYSDGFAIFPGGFGTLDELGEILTLVQTNKLPRLPIILIGVEYWQSIFDWIKNSAIPAGLITEHEASLITCTDDINEAAQRLQMHCDSLRCVITTRT